MADGLPIPVIKPITQEHYFSMLKQFKYNYRRKLVPLQ